MNLYPHLFEQFTIIELVTNLVTDSKPIPDWTVYHFKRKGLNKTAAITIRDIDGLTTCHARCEFARANNCPYHSIHMRDMYQHKGRTAYCLDENARSLLLL